MRQAIWLVFLDGYRAALDDALQHTPDWPHSAELQTALNLLLEQAGHINPGRIDSVLPRFELECATPQPL